MDREEIEQRFRSAGWSIDGSFAEYLIIGYSGDEMSLLSHPETWGDDDSVFVILDHDRVITHFVYEVPTPLQAAKMLQDHGKASDELELLLVALMLVTLFASVIDSFVSCGYCHSKSKSL